MIRRPLRKKVGARIKKKVPKKFIHKPWEIDDENILKLDDQYPLPIVNHENAREKALNAFKKFDLNIAVAMLEFFPRATGTFFISSDFF